MLDPRGNSTTAVISALPQELFAIKALMKNVSQNEATGFVKGILAGVNIVAGLSGMGKVNAAATTQKLISEYGASAFIFTGVAGGLNPKLNIGDIVWGDATLQYDYGFFADKLVTRYPGTLPELGLGNENQKLTFQLGFDDQRMSGQIYEVLQGVKLQAVDIDSTRYQPRLTRGIIATGDQFIANEKKKAELHEAFGADAVEMEGAAVAQVCHLNGVSCFLIRAISDNASAGAPKDFPKFMNAVADNNALLVEKFLSEFNRSNAVSHFNKL